MNKREIAILACRIFAIYAVFHVLIYIEYGLMGIWGIIHLYPPEQMGGILGLVGIICAPLAITLAFGICIWLRAEWVADRMLTNVDSANVASKPHAEDIQTIAFSVVGLVLITHAIPKLSVHIVQIYHLLQREPVGLWHLVEQCIAFVIEFGLGLWLLLGSRGLVKLIGTMRTAGTNPRKHVQE